MERLPNQKKTPPIAWIGFCLSLTVLILVLVFVSVVIFHPKNNELPFSSLFMLMFLVGGPLGILGLILSINGISSANKINGKSWPGICGIIFCCLSVLIVFIFPLLASLVKAHKIDAEYTQSAEATSTPVQNPDVVLEITEWDELKCYNKNNPNDAPATIRTYVPSFSHDLETWLQLNNVNTTSNIVITSDDNADFSKVVKVLDELKALQYSNIIVE